MLNIGFWVRRFAALGVLGLVVGLVGRVLKVKLLVHIGVALTAPLLVTAVVIGCFVLPYAAWVRAKEGR